jgi:hypothetical protein
MITQMESSRIYMGKGLARKWSEPIGRRDRVGAVKVCSRLWREMAYKIQTPWNYPEDNILNCSLILQKLLSALDKKMKSQDSSVGTVTRQQVG